MRRTQSSSLFNGPQRLTHAHGDTRVWRRLADQHKGLIDELLVPCDSGHERDRGAQARVRSSTSSEVASVR